MENRTFSSELPDDLNRIDVITTTSDNISLTPSDHQSSIGSRNFLTPRDESDVNFRYLNESPENHEHIELAGNGNAMRRKSSLFRVNTPIPTPTNMVRRWSQSISRFSKDKRSMRERTIYRLPSRQVFEVDGILLSADPDAELEQLAQEIEQHECLMQDTALSRQSRLETLRALPQSLSVKRILKTQLSIVIKHQHENDSERGPKRLIKLLLNFLISVILKLWAIFRLIRCCFKIWYNSLKTIEGHFGSNVSSYFKFLRWLLAFNVLLCVLPLSFIALPQALYNYDISRRNHNESALEISNRNSNLSVVNITHHNTIEEFNTTSEMENGKWSCMDILTGEGILKSSLMFYGSYSNVTFSYGNSTKSYSISHAYYMTNLISYLFVFVVISTSMARSYRKSFIESSGGMRSWYAAKVFCAWDYSISNRKAGELKHCAIFTELKEVLSELGDPKEKLSIWWRIWIRCSELIAHLLVSAMIAGLGVAFWIFLRKSENSVFSNSSWRKLLLPTVANMSILLLQVVLSWISQMEDYRSPRRTLHVMLVRNFLLESTIVGVLLYFWLTKETTEGWETALGQEIYRLIISDFCINLLVLPVWSCMRVFLILHFWPKAKRPEFDISQRSSGLVYNQTILWIGLFFAPLLGAIMVVKMVLLFYVNKATLIHLCKSPRHVWRSAQTHTLYLVFTFLSLLGVIVALGYIMTQVPISQQTGPFRGYAFMFQIFIDSVLKLRQNKKLWSILMFLIRPAVVGGMLIIMSIMVYYLHAKSRAHCMMVKILKEMIYLEAKDKEFLLTSITNITKDRNWDFNEMKTKDRTNNAEEIHAETSGTWRYRRRIEGQNYRGCDLSMASASNVVSTVDECILRNRNV